VDDFKELAQSQRTGIVSELWHFLSRTKKWWLLPIVIMLVSFGVLLALSGTAIAPFIYTLF
jgi:hypothetical protein